MLEDEVFHLLVLDISVLVLPYLTKSKLMEI